MRARPYDIVAYSPATISALMSASTTRTADSARDSLPRTWNAPGRCRPRAFVFWVRNGLPLRHGYRRRPCREGLRPDQDVLSVRSVLRHDVVVVGLSGGTELDRAAREDRVVPSRAHDR